MLRGTSYEPQSYLLEVQAFANEILINCTSAEVIKIGSQFIEGILAGTYAVINFCHDHPPPAHPRGFALKTLPHSGAFAS